MSEKQQLLSNIDKINITALGEQMIRYNLHLNEDEDVIVYCTKMLTDERCSISKMGSNWFCRTGNVVIPVDTASYTIFTAHLIR